MIVELLISGASYILFDYFEKREFKEYKKGFDTIIDRLPALKNNQGEKPYLIAYDPEEYGYKIKFILPVGITTDALQNNYKAIKEGFKLASINFTEKDRLIILYAIKDYNFKQYKPMKLKQNEILKGSNRTQ